MFILSLSLQDECQTLTRISRAAFHSDVLVGGNPNDGPPGYDSLTWHLDMQRQNHLYTFKADNLVVGGAVLFLYNTTLIVGRIFIDPIYHRKGYGQKLMLEIEHLFPNVILIKLDTPTWNTRTNSFYKKCGYKETNRTDESIFYEKKI